MKKTEFIGIITDNKGSVVGNLVFLLLKYSNFKVGLINNRLIKINEKIINKDILKYKDIEQVFTNQKDLDYIILDDLKTKYLNVFLRRYTIDTLIDNSVGDKEKRHIIEKRRIVNDNLKRNGISIINTDNKVISNYFSSLKDKIIITYGLNTKSTITASSLDIDENISFNCCIQRGLTTLNGNEIEQMEFPIKVRNCSSFDVSNFLSAIGLALIYEVPVVKIQDTIYKLNERDYI